MPSTRLIAILTAFVLVCAPAYARQFVVRPVFTGAAVSPFPDADVWFLSATVGRNGTFIHTWNGYPRNAIGTRPTAIYASISDLHDPGPKVSQTIAHSPLWAPENFVTLPMAGERYRVIWADRWLGGGSVPAVVRYRDYDRDLKPLTVQSITVGTLDIEDFKLVFSGPYFGRALYFSTNLSTGKITVATRTLDLVNRIISPEVKLGTSPEHDSMSLTGTFLSDDDFLAVWPGNPIAYLLFRQSKTVHYRVVRRDQTFSTPDRLAGRPTRGAQVRGSAVRFNNGHVAVLYEHYQPGVGAAYFCDSLTPDFEVSTMRKEIVNTTEKDYFGQATPILDDAAFYTRYESDGNVKSNVLTSDCGLHDVSGDILSNNLYGFALTSNRNYLDVSYSFPVIPGYKYEMRNDVYRVVERP